MNRYLGRYLVPAAALAFVCVAACSDDGTADERCGNGVLDPGEACEPSQGRCCNSDCTFLVAATICREAVGECDVAELCTGSAAACPADDHLRDGTSCTGGSCRSGACSVDSSEQTEVWGENEASDHPGTTSDTYVNAGAPDDAYGSEETLVVYAWPADEVANRIFLKWDLSALPAGAVISSATLALYLTGSLKEGGDDLCTIEAAAVTGVDPVLAESTWNQAATGVPWAGGSDGGAANLAAPESATSVGLAPGWQTWDVTTMVSQWHGGETNLGMALSQVAPVSADTSRVFASAEHANASWRPKLTISWSGPATSRCGNGQLDAGEQCDGGACCDSDCRFMASGTVCRAEAGQCDVAETCSGSAAACPADEHAADGSACEGGTCHGGECFASGSGRELYVSPSGSDSVTYAANSISTPWRTPNKAWAEARAGDTVYFREGTYAITTLIDNYSAENGTASEPITFTNYGSEQVTFSSTLTPAIRIHRNYNYVSGINIIADGGTFFHVAKNYTATNFMLSHCTGKLNVAGGAANYGIVVFQADRARDGRVEDCVFTGPGAGENDNTAAVFIFRTTGVKVKSCEFTAFPRPIYFKHTCVDSPTGIEFSGNYFHGNGEGIVSTANYALIEDNLFVGNDLVMGTGGGLGDAGDNNGGDHNTIRHNTFYNAHITLLQVSDGDGSGCQYNTIEDNVITEKSMIHEYSPQPHYSTTDYNLYPLGDVIRENRIDYTLPAWQSYHGQDGSSLSATPSFVGGSSPFAISDYALSPGAAGAGAASDGQDMGANLSRVGPSL